MGSGTGVSVGHDVAVGVDMGADVAVGCCVAVGGADVGRSVGWGVDVADEPPHDMTRRANDNPIAALKPIHIGSRIELRIRPS